MDQLHDENKVIAVCNALILQLQPNCDTSMLRTTQDVNLLHTSKFNITFMLDLSPLILSVQPALFLCFR